MQVKLIDKKIKDIKSDLELTFVVNKNFEHRFVGDKKILEEMNFKGGTDEIAYLPEKKKIYVGVDSLKHGDLRVATAQVVRQVLKLKVKKVKIGLYFDKDAGKGIKALCEGFLLGAYEFDKYKSKPKKHDLNEVLISSECYGIKNKVDLKLLQKSLTEGIIISQNVNFVRDIVNEPPSDLTPVEFSKIAKEIGKKNKLNVQVFGEKELKKSGMNAFLGVNRASAYPPQLIHLDYKPKKSKLKIVLVGKGLTYDTGGLSLKPSDSMVTMKTDMGGAAAILGVITAVSQMKLPIEIHSIIGATENSIGKDAYKPDDILRAMNGKTIEVKNTDAEGRLVLADCLCYAQKENFDYILDIATLTGAAMVALGEYTSAVLGHNYSLNQDIIKSAEKAGELVAYLPFNKYLEKLITSEIADIANVSASRFGGAITAGLFLSEFIEEKNKNRWVHIDIAGPAHKNKTWGENPFGASGAGVRMLVEWIKSLV